MNSSAAVAMQMKSTFTSIRFGLMVGIGGGVPNKEADIQLGDVVVRKPHKIHGGVVQCDSGKTIPSGFERTGALNTPPTVLLNAVANLQAEHIRERGELLQYLSKLDHLPRFTRVDADAQGIPYGNALQAASLILHKEVATVLLEKGALRTHS